MKKLLQSSPIYDILQKAEHGERLSFEDGVRLFVDPKSFVFLDGTELDFVTNIMGYGFKFNNPNSKGACGCGESVQF